MGLAADLTLTADGTSPAPGLRRRWWRRRPAVVAAAVVAAVGLGLVAARSSPPVDRVVDRGPAPGFDLPRVGSAGERVRMSDFAGQPLVVNFWASWCVPCRREMPALQAVAARLEGRVSFIGVNHQDGAAAAAAFERDVGVSYPSGYDPDGKVAAAYGVAGLPTTVLVDAQGRIVARHLGALTDEGLAELVRQAFGVDAGAPR